MADYSKAIALDANDGAAYRKSGIIYEAKGDLKRAYADFNTADKLEPRSL